MPSSMLCSLPQLDRAAARFLPVSSKEVWGEQGEGECIVIDTNIVLHQLDFLDQTTSQGILQNVIILQTVRALFRKHEL